MIPFRGPVRLSRNLLLFVTALTALAGLAPATHAGLLQELYLSRPELEPSSARLDPGYLAALEDVEMQLRRRYPRAELKASELWVDQTIGLSGNVAFPRGKEQYRARRVGLEIDQPLYDPTIAPEIAASRARLRQVDALGRVSVEGRTRALVENFLRACRHRDIADSAARVVTRLETELNNVQRSRDAHIATLSDVQNIRLALSSTRLERNNHHQGLLRAVSALGPDAADIRAWPALLNDADLIALADYGLGRSHESPDVEVLFAAADELGHQASSLRRSTLPVFSLSGYYGSDDSEKSLFGGARDFRFFEGGLTVRWVFFDRGMNYSQARATEHRRRAAEAAAFARSGELRRNRTESRRLLTEAATVVAELADIVAQHKTLNEATSRAYEAGHESYMNAIRAYLSYESAYRDHVNARYDLLHQSVSHLAEAIGWSDSLVSQLDALFTASIPNGT
jgi:outer membrane protein TolC